MIGWVEYFPPLNLLNWTSFFGRDIMHPLIGNLEELSNEEIQKKYDELMKKYNQAFRFGPTSVLPQMQMILESYQSEMNKRNRKTLEDMEKKSDKFKGIIDIQ